MTLYVVLGAVGIVALVVFFLALGSEVRLRRRAVAYTYQREIDLTGAKQRERRSA